MHLCVATASIAIAICEMVFILVFVLCFFSLSMASAASLHRCAHFVRFCFGNNNSRIELNANECSIPLAAMVDRCWLCQSRVTVCVCVYALHANAARQTCVKCSHTCFCLRVIIVVCELHNKLLDLSVVWKLQRFLQLNKRVSLRIQVCCAMKLIKYVIYMKTLFYGTQLNAWICSSC